MKVTYKHANNYLNENDNEMNFFSGSLFAFITAMIVFHIKYGILRHHASLII